MSGKREGFSSRIGFILVSAGCAIGLGNVWKFPWLCGQYGGAAFILIYLLFLLILGIPVLTTEFAIGRGSQKSAALAFEKLEPAGTKWHHLKWISVVGCYMLMMYYTTVAGWIIYYCFRTISGEFAGKSPDDIGAAFGTMLGSPGTMVFWTILICLLGFLICFFGIEKGVERVTKYMMVALLAIMVILAVHSVTLQGAGEGVKFYLVPNFESIEKAGLFNVIFAAMSQAFFTLSIGIGSMMIFGSYINKDRALTGEAISITSLDTFVALMAGMIIIPSCFAFGVQPDAGPSLIFVTIPNIFAKMQMGTLWGGLFFLFLTFAALSTVVAVFENLIAYLMELCGWDRGKSTFVNFFLIIVLSMPCVLGYNVLSGVQLLGEGSTILDFEDFIVSNNLLPLGSLAYILFSTSKNGWGWDAFLKEANSGKGINFPGSLFSYMKYILPAIIIAIYLKGYYDFFKDKDGLLIPWMAAAVIFLGFVMYISLSEGKKKSAVSA